MSLFAGELVAQWEKHLEYLKIGRLEFDSYLTSCFILAKSHILSNGEIQIATLPRSYFMELTKTI